MELYGIPPEGNRRWEIVFESVESDLTRITVAVDPADGKVIGTIGG